MPDQETVDVAKTRFERARVKAFWKAILSLITGSDDHLVKWEQAQKELAPQGGGSVELASVPLDQIVGTVGRYEDFDRAFLPTHDALSDRWRAMDRAYEAGIGLPPILLYQVGDAYFCVDGHHRISVARQRGMQYLEAQVIKVRTRVPISGHLDHGELALKGEYVRFLDRTKLEELRPEQRIEFTIPGGYDRLLRYIALYASQGSGHASDDLPPEAVCDWYDHDYLPLIQIIREREILAEFPARSEADLYLWLLDHQAELRAQCGPEVDRERIATHYAERHGRHILTRATSALRDWLSQDECELVTTGSKAR